jgi:indolepyruvate ferredoxin oxidoreductase beta subunit
MSQRGGDVISTVRFGDQVFSPLPALGETDYILAFEKLEALRNINYLAAQGIVLVNDFEWQPLPVAAGFEKYPQDVVERLRRLAGELVLIPATRLAAELGNDKASNVVLIGLLASRMQIDKPVWLEVLRKKVPPRFLDLNLKAFESGYGFKA